eukprot:1162083-Pelagomonas_calceolata.AAC.2
MPDTTETNNWPARPPKQNSSWREGDALKSQPMQKAGRQAEHTRDTSADLPQERSEINSRGESKATVLLLDHPAKIIFPRGAG